MLCVWFDSAVLKIHIGQCQFFYLQCITYTIAQSEEETTNAIDNEEVVSTSADQLPPADQSDNEATSDVADSNDQSEPTDSVPSSSENAEVETTNNDQTSSSDQNDATENVAEPDDQPEPVNSTDETDNAASNDVDAHQQADQDAQEVTNEEAQEVTNEGAQEEATQNEPEVTSEVVEENISEDPQEIVTESGESSEPETTQPNVSEAPEGFTCEHVGRFEYPNSCTSYYYCWDTEHAFAVFHCPKAFDPVSKHCVEYFNGCSLAPTCETDRSVFSYPGDKTAYFECRSNKKAGIITFQVEREYCSKGREFNPNLGYCELIETSGIELNHEPADHFVCDKVGIFIDFANESRYYECVVKNVSKGELKAISRKCPKYTMFSGESNTCIPIAR